MSRFSMSTLAVTGRSFDRTIGQQFHSRPINSYLVRLGGGYDRDDYCDDMSDEQDTPSMRIRMAGHHVERLCAV